MLVLSCFNADNVQQKKTLSTVLLLKCAIQVNLPRLDKFLKNKTHMQKLKWIFEREIRSYIKLSFYQLHKSYFCSSRLFIAYWQSVSQLIFTDNK